MRNAIRRDRWLYERCLPAMRDNGTRKRCLRRKLRDSHSAIADYERRVMLRAAAEPGPQREMGAVNSELANSQTASCVRRGHDVLPDTRVTLHSNPSVCCFQLAAAIPYHTPRTLVSKTVIELAPGTIPTTIIVTWHAHGLQANRLSLTAEE